MTAYELTKELSEFMTEDKYTDLDKTIFKTCNMLRQQADRIAELEKCLFQMQNACIDLAKQNSEPVAWINPKELQDPELTSTAVSKNKMYPQDIPLYTTPQVKELSDEEIIEIGNAVVNLIDSNEGWIEFARAILKKASEK
jgi:hypothetical protein